MQLNPFLHRRNDSFILMPCNVALNIATARIRFKIGVEMGDIPVIRYHRD